MTVSRVQAMVMDMHIIKLIFVHIHSGLTLVNIYEFKQTKFIEKWGGMSDLFKLVIIRIMRFC